MTESYIYCRKIISVVINSGHAKRVKYWGKGLYLYKSYLKISFYIIFTDK